MPLAFKLRGATKVSTNAFPHVDNFASYACPVVKVGQLYGRNVLRHAYANFASACGPLSSNGYYRRSGFKSNASEIRGTVETNAFVLWKIEDGKRTKSPSARSTSISIGGLISLG